jgi:hypothetical protein
MLLVVTEVAVTVAVVVTEMVAGAVYTTEVVVLPLNEPGPDRLQVTPALLVSLATEAVMVTVPPGFRVCPEAGVNVIERVLLLPEQPAKTIVQTRIPNASNERAFTFLTVSPTEVLTISSRNSNSLE